MDTNLTFNYYVKQVVSVFAITLVIYFQNLIGARIH